MQELEEARAKIRFIEMTGTEKAELLKRACDSKGVTLYALAKRLKLKNAQQCYVYAKRGQYGFNRMEEIAKALDLTVYDFLSS